MFPERVLVRAMEKVGHPIYVLFIAVIFVFAVFVKVSDNTRIVLVLGLIVAVLFVCAILFVRHEDKKKFEREERRRHEERRKQEELSPAMNPNSTSMERYRRQIESQDARKFWKSFVQGELQVVTGHFTKANVRTDDHTDEDKVWEPAGLIGKGDAMAIADPVCKFQSITSSEKRSGEVSPPCWEKYTATV